MKMYTCYDSKAETYTKPLFHHSKGEAIRAFSDQVNDQSNPNNLIAKHPHDFSLFELGEYDERSAKFIISESKIALGTGQEFKTQE